MIEQQWPNTAKVFLVNDRTTETIQNLLEEHCEIGCMVHHDGWRAYENIDWNGLGLLHEEHIHRTP